MPDQTMIERVARAVREEIAHPHDGEFMVEGGFRGDDYFADIARAVLAAMREPTAAAIDIGIFKMRSGGPMSPDERVTAIWEPMIDAALEDGR